MFLIAFALTLFFPKDTLAYLDPGTGSMMLQLIVGGVAAGLYTLKLYWQNMKIFFKTHFGKLSSKESFSENNNDRDGH